MVGQLNAAKQLIPLSHEFEEFVNDSDHGFIIVSFGTNVAALSKEKVDMLATAFGKLRQKVVWRLKGKQQLAIVKNRVIDHNFMHYACKVLTTCPEGTQ